MVSFIDLGGNGSREFVEIKGMDRAPKADLLTKVLLLIDFNSPIKFCFYFSTNFIYFPNVINNSIS